MRNINPVLLFALIAMFGTSVLQAQIVLINLKKYKLIATMPGEIDTVSHLKDEKLKVMFCDESMIPQNILSEIQQKGMDNMPREKLFTEMTYTRFQTKTDKLNFFIGYLPFDPKIAHEVCYINMTTAFARMFDEGFDGNTCSNELDKASYTDVNGVKRDVRSCVCTDGKRSLVYRVYYFDDRLYFMAVYGNVPLVEGSQEFKDMQTFINSFNDKS